MGRQGERGNAGPAGSPGDKGDSGEDGPPVTNLHLAISNALGTSEYKH